MAERVTVVGAGLTGLTVGLLCARAGHSVRVVDAGLRVGDPRGLMAAPATVQQELQYHHVWRWLGDTALATYGHLVRLGQAFVLAAAGDMGLDVHRADAATVTADGTEAFWLRYEARAMRDAKLDPEFTDTTGLPFSTRPQLVSADQPAVNPVTYRDALAVALVTAGGQLIEELPPDADAGWLVSTTPQPVFDRVGIRPRLRPATWNWVSFTADDPAVLPTRHTFDLDEGGRVLTVTGDRIYLGSRRAPSIDWVTRHVEGARILDQWQAETAATFDGAPFVGFAGSPGDKRLVACGFDAWELTLGSVAALHLAGVIGGEVSPLPWQPVRVPRPGSVGRALWGSVRHGLRISPVTPFPRRG